MSIAARYGFSDPNALLDHPDNADLKQRRKTPSVLHPGDVIALPDREEKSVEVAAGTAHRFKVKVPTALVRIALQVDGAYHYELSIDADTWTGKTDGSTPIEHPIRPDARDGVLLLWPDTDGNEDAREGLQRIPVHLGHLDPVEEISGAQGILANLGLYHGPVDGRLSDALRVAVARFQEKAGLEVTGDLDDALRDKLRAEHDG